MSRRASCARAEREIAYDYLIVATGSRHSYFGHDEWEKLAPGLKSLEDAIEIRRRILMAFEFAEKTEDPAARAAAMNFVIIGGGPTGVEMAGAIAEIARETLAKDFRHIDPSNSRVILIEGEKRVLSAFPEDLSASALKQLQELGVEVTIGRARRKPDRERPRSGRQIHSLPGENLGRGKHRLVCRQNVRRAGRSRRSRHRAGRPDDSRPSARCR